MGAVVKMTQADLGHDGSLHISTGEDRFSTSWKNTTVRWSQLVARLAKSKETGETHAEFMKATKDKQDKIKDIGGFVGGHLKEGLRRSANVLDRQILTLDVDFAPDNFWFKMTNGLLIDHGLDFALAVYSTHKHTDTNPRYRVVIPLDRPVGPEEYEAIGRKVAEKIGIDYFDDSTFQPSRLMYWPSHSKDVAPYFNLNDAPFLSADAILGEYPDWADVSFWPESSRSKGLKKRSLKKLGDPTDKDGAIGVFCRTYTVPEAIEAFLGDVYTPTSQADRFTYAAGSTAAGLVIYQDGAYAYSNHSTDPAGGRCCNAFDLVRIHLFGELDVDVVDDKTPASKYPSFEAMTDFVWEQDACLMTNAADFGRIEDEEGEEPEGAEGGDRKWLTQLIVDKKGVPKPCYDNAAIIIGNDPQLAGLALNDMSGCIESRTKRLPWRKNVAGWREEDEAQLVYYLHHSWKMNISKQWALMALQKVTDDRRFNPLEEYINSLPPWDGNPRVDTILIDYLGAEDTEYNRCVARKTLIGAMCRALLPRCKFDHMLVLDGTAGIGKSTLLRKLGGEWFTDDLSFADMRDKTAAEKIQGYWIAELAEMQGMRKTDSEYSKSFLSREVDLYRSPYARKAEERPRRCILVGTTNNTDGFLQDLTGNRRYWPVYVRGGRLSPWDITEEIRAQIWAEAKMFFESGEQPYLDDDMEQEAAAIQKDALRHDDREGFVREYLDTLLPEGWYNMSLEARREYFWSEYDRPEGTMLREYVSPLEIYCECFGNPIARYDPYKDSKSIKTILAGMDGWEPSDKRRRSGAYGPVRGCYERIQDF